MLPNCAGIVAVFGRVLVSPTRQTTTNNGRTSFFMLGVFKSRRATSQRRYSLANGSTQGFLKPRLYAEMKDRYLLVQKICAVRVAPGFFPFGQTSFSLATGARSSELKLELISCPARFGHLSSSAHVLSLHIRSRLWHSTLPCAG